MESAELAPPTWLRTWAAPELAAYCNRTWGVTPQPTWFEPWLGAVENSSRIIFTNGELDPWRGGGVRSSRAVEAGPTCNDCARPTWGMDDLIKVSVPQGAHVFDLAGAHAGDTAGVRQARETVIEILASWLTRLKSGTR